MNLNPIMEAFYKGILDYADLTIEDDNIACKDARLGAFTVEGRHVCLPYFELLKNPDNRLFFHPLNENYASPENAVFDHYRNKLSFTINTRLAHLIITAITIASEISIQKKVTSGTLTDFISAVGEVSLTAVDSFQKVLKAAFKKDKYSPLFDIYLKKNGEINGTPYAAIGKINFKFFEELKEALEDSNKKYSVFDVKISKKDILSMYSIMEAIFPNIDKKDYYVEGTDNKIFRYLNALLKTSYLVTSRINEIGEELLAIKEPALAAEELISNHCWIEQLEKLYGMANEIRLIPSQVDINVEAKRLKLDETKAAQAQMPSTATQQQNQPPSFNPNIAAAQQVTQQPQQQIIQQPQQLSPEDIIRGSLQPQMNPMMMPGMMNPMMMQPGMMAPIGMMQPQTPSWVQAELMKEQQQQIQQQLQQQLLQQQQNNMQQGAMPNTMNPAMLAAVQQQMLQQQMQMQQPMMINPLTGMMVQQPTGLQLNPHFAGAVRAPFS